MGWGSFIEAGAEMFSGAADEVAGVFQGGADAVATAAPGDWWSKGLTAAMPQILGMTGKKGGNRAPTSTASAKPVNGNASSAMQVPKMIGESANNNPLDNLNQWSNLF